MRVKYSPLFLAILKKVDVRIYKSLKRRISILIQNSSDSQLNNHALRTVVYFVTLGTHEQLFVKNKKLNDS